MLYNSGRMKDIFVDIPKVVYEGPQSDNPLAFHFYNPEEQIDGQLMAELLRFSVAFWHSMVAGGSDPFGLPTMRRPWDDEDDPRELARLRARAALELAHKLSIPFFCFHDRDIAPEMGSLRESNRRLDEMVVYLKALMPEYGVRLLWGTANLFAHPRYVHGAATSPEAAVFAHAAAQVHKAIEITHELGGENYVFWGGREGYETLLNTDMRLELDNMARFLGLARDYARSIGFSGQLLLEPKPKEPTTHQYDFDVASVANFLQHYGLLQDFKLNIEANHATLAGHTMQHELRLARLYGLLGSVDANRGDMLLGWDTDQFAANLYDAVFTMYEILQNGGLGRGGLNFDAKVRRGSFELRDLFYAHISAMDALAVGYKVARRLLQSGELEDFIAERYRSYSSGVGRQIVAGEMDLSQLADWASSQASPLPESGRQEMLEALVNRHLMAAIR